VVDSVTKMLYDLGWSGINIEPGPSFVNFSSRDRDINLPYALTSSEGEVDFHYNASDPGTSTTASSNISPDQSSIRSYKVHSITLEKLVREHAQDRHIHFLKLDVEGAEWDIIQSTDWHVVRPELIVAESSFPYTNERRDAGWADHMKLFGYHEVFFDGINTYYLCEESMHRSNAFKFPVNVLDGVRKFDPYQHYSLDDSDGTNLLKNISKEITRVVEAEGSAVREYLENDLNASVQAQRDLVARLTAEQSENFARLRSIAEDLSTLAPDPEQALTGNVRANSIDAIIEQMAEGVSILTEQRNRDGVELALAREAAESARADAEEHERRAEEARAEARLLSSRLTAARASRNTILEMTERVVVALDGVSGPPQMAPTPIDDHRPTSASRNEPGPLARRIAIARTVPAWRRALRFRNRALVRRADAYRDSGNWSEAAVAYARSYALRPDRPDLCLQLANMLTQLRMFDIAEDAYREALAKAPGDGFVLLHFGHMLELSGRPVEARQIYLKSAEAIPNHHDVVGGLSRTIQPQSLG
jgi:FkbM family methyltransferase